MRRDRAFTLAEIMVAVALFGGLTLVLFSFLRFTARTQGRVVRRGLLIDSASQGLAVLTERLQRAPTVERPSKGDKSDSVILKDLKGESWTVALKGVDLVLSRRYGTERTVLARNVDRFQAERDENDLLVIGLVLSTDRVKLPVRTAAYLRGAHREPVEVQVKQQSLGRGGGRYYYRKVR